MVIVFVKVKKFFRTKGPVFFFNNLLKVWSFQRKTLPLHHGISVTEFPSQYLHLKEDRNG